MPGYGARRTGFKRGEGATPHFGTLEISLVPDRRRVTLDRAIFYFVVDEDRQEVLILAIFFGGQDHQRRMLGRLL
jgi:toxin ParE1/3/4